MDSLWVFRGSLGHEDHLVEFLVWEDHSDVVRRLEDGEQLRDGGANVEISCYLQVLEYIQYVVGEMCIIMLASVFYCAFQISCPGTSLSSDVIK